MNPLFSMYVGMGQNPLQRAIQAMMNPAAFVRQVFPDIPVQIQNDPNQILSYLQQTKNISNSDIQNLVSQYPYPGNNMGNYFPNQRW